MTYKIKLLSRARDDLYQIKHYISDVLKSLGTAQNVLNRLTKIFSRLTLFPQAGFDADQKLGMKPHPVHRTYGYVFDKYLLFYTIHEQEQIVWISHILDLRSDYLSLLLVLDE